MSRPAAILIICLAPVAAAGDRRGTLTLPPEARVSGDLITAGDLFGAEELRAVFGSDADDVAGTVLAPAPAVGRTAPLGASTIAARLRPYASASPFDLRGNARVLVQRSDSARAAAPTRPLPPAGRTRLTRGIEEAVQAYLAVVAPRLGRVAVTADLSDDEARTWPHSSQISLAGGVAPYTGRQTFLVSSPDKSATAVRVNVEAVPWRFVAAHDLDRGIVLSARDLTPAQNPDGAEDAADLIGRKLTKPIRGGEPIPEQASESVPLVKPNNVVSAVVRKRGLTVRRLMRARGTGGLGEEVTLVPLDGGRERLVGRVIGFQEVELVTASAAGVR
ncbi:MAG: flagella basal body P-ring formation protein FlgA [Planctomycetota bacterium]